MLQRKILLFFGCLLALLLLSSAIVLSFFNSDYLAKTLSKHLGQQDAVAIGSIQPTFFHGVVIRDVQVKNKGQLLANIPEIRIEADLLAAIRKPSAYLQAFGRLTLVQPEVWVARDQQGKWNFADLLPKKKEKQELSADLRAKFQVQQGTIHLTDGKKQIKNLRLTKVNGLGDFATNPGLTFQLEAQENALRVAADGVIDITRKEVQTDIRIKNMDLAAWKSFLPWQDKLSVEEGLLSGTVEISGYYPQGLVYQGDLALLEGKVQTKLVGLPLEKIQAKVKLLEEKIVVKKASFALGKSLFSVQGDVYPVQQPLADLQIISKHMDFDQLLTLKPLRKYRANLSKYLRGTGKGRLQLLYDGKKVKIDDAAFSYQQGTIKGSGAYVLKTQDYNAALRLKKFSLAGLSIPVEKGLVSGKLRVSGQGKKLRYAEGKIQVQKTGWQDIPINYVWADAVWQEGQLAIKELLLDSPHLKGRLFGTAGDKTSLHANMTQIDLAFWGKKYQPRLALAGTGSFVGQVMQDQQGLTVKGDLFANRGRIMGQPFSLLTGNILLKDDQVNIDQVVIKDHLTNLSIDGTMALKGAKKLNLILRSEKVELTSLLALAGLQPKELQGEVAGVAHIGGTVENPNVRGQFSLTDASYQEERIDTGELNFHYQNHLLHLNQLQITMGKTNFMAQGQITGKGEGQFLVTCDDLDLEQIPYLRNKLTEGSKTGQITGRIQVMDAFKTIRLHSVQVMHGENRYRLKGDISLRQKEPRLQLVLTLEDSDLNLLPALVPTALPHNFVGRLQGEIKIWGKAKDPSMRAKLEITEGKIGSHPVGKAKTDLLWDRHVLTIFKLVVPVDGGVLLAQGHLSPKGAIKLDVAGKNLAADIIRELYELPEEVGGTFHFNVQMHGQTKEPQANGYLEVTDGKINQAAFDRLSALLTMQKKQVHVETVTLEKGHYKLAGQGIVSLEKKGAIDLTLRMKEGDLGLLAVLCSKEIDSASGDASAWLNIGGTLEKPLIKGEISIYDGTIKPKMLKEPITNINAQLVSQQTTVEVKYLTGMIGGGSFMLTGRAEQLFTPKAQLNFALETDKIRPKTALFTGQISSSLLLTGSQMAPLLKGNVVLEKGDVKIPTQIGKGSGVDFPLKLDIRTEIRDNLEVNHMFFGLKLVGAVNTTGTLAKPEMDGVLTAKKGSINYMGTKFRLLKGSVTFMPKNGLLPDVQIVSKARVGEDNIMLLAKGNVSDLEVEFISDPPMSKNEIIMLLTLGQRVGADETELNLNNDILRLAGQTLSVGFLQGVEKNIGDSLGLDEFYLNSNLSGSPQLVLGKSFLNDKLYVTYTLNTRLIEVEDKRDEETEEWFLEAQYELPRNLHLTYTRNDLGEDKVMLMKSFRF